MKYEKINMEILKTLKKYGKYINDEIKKTRNQRQAI